MSFITALKDTIDTLSINTLYDFITEAYYNNRLIAYSNIDSIYTDAQLADIDTAYWITDSSFIFTIDVKNNPTWTLYGLMDSQRALQGSTNVNLDNDSTRWLPSIMKKSYTDWGGATGDTIILYSRYINAGDTLKLRLKTYSGDSTAWGM